MELIRVCSLLDATARLEEEDVSNLTADMIKDAIIQVSLIRDSLFIRCEG